jgi:hypothetical protein
MLGHAGGIRPGGLRCSGCRDSAKDDLEFRMTFFAIFLIDDLGTYRCKLRIVSELDTLEGDGF